MMATTQPPFRILINAFPSALPHSPSSSSPGVFGDFADEQMTYSFIWFQGVILLLNMHHITEICLNPPLKSKPATLRTPTLLASSEARVRGSDKEQSRLPFDPSGTCPASLGKLDSDTIVFSINKHNRSHLLSTYSGPHVLILSHLIPTTPRNSHYQTSGRIGTA